MYHHKVFYDTDARTCVSFPLQRMKNNILKLIGKGAEFVGFVRVRDEIISKLEEIELVTKMIRLTQE